MCEWGIYKTVRLAYPREISRSEEVGVDSCISGVIQALNNHKIHTLGCCCGHNKANPSIVISDNYTDKEIENILYIISELDNRNWEIFQWRIYTVAKSQEGIIIERNK